jgi:YD repeat-containing protein
MTENYMPKLARTVTAILMLAMTTQLCASILPVKAKDFSLQDQQSLESSLNDLKTIQDINSSNTQNSYSNEQNPTVPDVFSADEFDNLGKTIQPKSPNSKTNQSTTTDNLELENKAPSILDFLGGVKVHAQSDDTIYRDFNQGNLQLPWTAGDQWTMTLGYDQPPHGRDPITGDYVPVTAKLINFARNGEANTFNRPVLAMTSGRVVTKKLGCAPAGSLGCNSGWGNYVVIQVSPDKYIGYHHLSLISVNVGDVVTQGFEIGRSGASGFITGGSNIQIGLFDNQQDLPGAKSYEFPTTKGKDITLNESPIANFSDRTGHWFESTNVEANFDDDGDGFSNANDNCPAIANPDQKDSNGDGIGDACDKDNDGREDYVSDNCSPPSIWDGTGLQFFYNPDQKDTDGNRVGDTCDIQNCTDVVQQISDETKKYLCNPDFDGDGIINNQDNCVFVANPSQEDLNNNGVGDACDLDTMLSRKLFNPKAGYYRNMGYDIPAGYAGDPVNTSNGNFSHTETDVNLPGPSRGVQEELEPELALPVDGLKMERTYNSVDNRSGIFGKGWSSNLLTYVDFYQKPNSNGTITNQYGVNIPGGNADLFERTAKDCPEDNSNPGCYTFNVPAESTGTTTNLVYQPSAEFSAPELQWAQSCSIPTNPNNTELEKYNKYKQDLEKYGIGFKNSPNGADGKMFDYGQSSNQKPKYSECYNFLYTDKFGSQTSYHWDTATDLDPSNDWKAGLPILTKTRDGQIIIYEFAKNDQKAVAPNGASTSNAQNFIYLKSISNDFGQKLSFSFENGLLRSVTDNLGRVTSYGYDFDGNLISITKPDNASTNYGYDSNGLLSTITDPTGRITLSNKYQDGKVVEQKDGKGQTTKIEYQWSQANPNNAATTIQTLRDGQKKEQTHDDLGRLTSETDQQGNQNTYEYKPNSFAKIKEIDALGRETKYEYDAQDNPIKITLADGSTSENKYNSNSQLIEKKQGDRVTTLTYDGPRLTSKILPGNSKSEFIWSVKNFDQVKPTLASNKQSLPDSLKPKEGDLAQFYILSSYKDPNGNQTTWNFNDANHISEIKNAQGGQAKLEYDSIGRITARISPEEGRTEISYDGRDNIVQTKNSLGGITKYGYLPNDLLDSKLEPSGLLTIYNYDQNKKLTLTRQCFDTQVVTTCRNKPENPALYDKSNPQGLGFDQNKPNLSPVFSTFTHYDTKFTYDSEDRLTSTTDPEGRITKYTLDEKGQRIETENPDGSKTKKEYDAVGNVTRSEDELGRATVYAYDQFNRTKSVIRPDQRTSTTKYDQFGNVTEFQDFDGNTLKMSYDQRNNLTSQIDKEGRTTKFSYDLNNNLIQKEDAAGNKFALSYSPLNKVTIQTLPNGLIAKNTYNNAGQIIKVENLDVTDPNNQKAINQTQFSYDQAGNLISTTNPLGGVSLTKYDSSLRPIESIQYSSSPAPNTLVGTLKTEYDVLGRVSKTVDPVGAITQINYTPTSKVAQVTDPKGNISYNHYDIRGNLIKQTNANGDSRHLSYNLNNTLRCESDFKLYDKQFLPNNGDKFDQYVFDTVRIPQNKEVLNGKQTSCYEYDVLDRAVKKVDAQGQETKYEYDRIGNMVRSINPKGQETKFKYDKERNLVEASDTAGAITKFSYDALNRLISTTNAKNQITVFGYNPVGKQTLKILPNSADGKNIDPTKPINVDQLRQDGWSVYTYAFNPLSSLTSETDPNNQTLSYEYSPAQLVSKQTDAQGNSTSMSYDGLGRLVEKSYPTGSKESFAYDARSLLTSQTNIYGGQTKFEYDPNGNQIRQITPLGNVVTQDYDKLNRLVKVNDLISGNKPVQTIEYNPNGLITKQTDAEGYQIENRYDPLNRVIQVVKDDLDETKLNTKFGDSVDTKPNTKASKSYRYDALGLLVESVDELNNQTKFDYNNQNNLVATTLPNGAKTSLELDNLGNLTKLTDPETRITQYQLDGQNRTLQITNPENGLVKFEYDKAGNLVKSQDPNGNVNQTNYIKLYNYLPKEQIDALNLKQTFEYDGVERLVKQTDKNGNVYQTSFNDAGRSVTVQKPEGMVETTKLNALGQIIQSIQGNGANYVSDYDARGRLVKSTNPDGGVNRNQYDNLNRLIKQINGLNGETTYQLDPNGNPVQTTLPDGETSYNFYDQKGRKTVQILPTSKSGLNLNSAKSSDGLAKSTFSYDSVDNLIESTDPYGAKTKAKYDQVYQTREVTNALNNTSKYDYDKLGNLIQVTDAEGGIAKMEYDKNSNLIKSSDPNNNPTSYKYTPRNELAEKIDALGRSQKYVYDKNGNEINWIKADGVVRVQDFDGLDRVKARQYQDKDKKVLAPGTFVFSYNPIDNLTKVEQTNSDGSKLNHNFGYDQMGRMTTQDDGKNQISYGYDQNSNLTTETINQAGKTLQTNVFNYSKGNKTIKANNYTLAYDTAGQLIKRVTGDQENDLTSYDLLGRVKSFQVVSNNNEGKNSNYGFKDRQYDALGRLTEQQNTTLGKSEKYTYDKLDRLTSYEYPGNKQEYGYDKAGNRTSLKVNGTETSFSYDKVNQLNQSEVTKGGKKDTTNFTYDLNGNRTQVKTGNTVQETNSFDAENSLIKSVQTFPTNGNGQPSTTQEANYQYDFLHRPISINTKTTFTVPGNANGNPNLAPQSSNLTVTYRRFTFDKLVQTKNVTSLLVDNATSGGSSNNKDKGTPNDNSQGKNKNCPSVPSATCDTTSVGNANQTQLPAGNYSSIMLADPNTRQLLGSTIVTPNWDQLPKSEKDRWTFDIHTDHQNTTHVITQRNNQSAILSQAFDPFGQTLDSKLNLGSLSNPQIKTREDLTNLNIPIPGFQGSSLESANKLNFGRRTYDPNTASFSSVDPVANGVSYDPMANSQLVGHKHGIGSVNGYSINNQNSLMNREWDGYCEAFDYTCQDQQRNSINQAQGDINNINNKATELNQKGNDLNNQVSSLQSDIDNRSKGLQDQVGNLQNKAANLQQAVQNGDYLIKHVYIPSWLDYAGSAEKIAMDNLETQIAFASICKSDTTYPYGCNSFHSKIAQNYDLSVSPNIKGFADYQRKYTRVWFTLDEDRLNNDIAALTKEQESIQNDAKNLEEYAKNKSAEIQSQAADLQAQAKSLDDQYKAASSKINDAQAQLQDAQKWNTIATIGVGILAGVACTVATAGVGAVACAAGAGALVAGLSNLNSQFINTGDFTKTNLQELGVNIVVGGILGGLGEFGGQALGAGIKALANTGAGKVVTSGISSLTSKAIGGVGNLTSKALGGIDNMISSGITGAKNVGSAIMKPINEAIDSLVAPSYALPGGGSVKFIATQADEGLKATDNVVMSSASSATSNASKNVADTTVEVSLKKYTDAAQHISDAQAAGQPSILTIERTGAIARRNESLKGIAKVANKDLDEYPAAMFAEGGSGSSVRAISPSSNRSAGSYIGGQLRKYPNGTTVLIKVVE